MGSDRLGCRRAALPKAYRILDCSHGIELPREPPDMTVPDFAVFSDGSADLHPSTRWPLSDT